MNEAERFDNYTLIPYVHRCGCAGSVLRAKPRRIAAQLKQVLFIQKNGSPQGEVTRCTRYCQDRCATAKANHHKSAHTAFDTLFLLIFVLKIGHKRFGCQ